MSRQSESASKKKPEIKLWWHEGVRFQCQGSGKCCVSHGEFGFVFLSLEDRKRFAKYFNLSTSAFTRKYCVKLSGAYHLKEDPKDPNCMFLKNKRCSVYEARPTQCRTWPFWPEVMSPKAWKKEVQSFCPGVNKGKVHSKKEIDHKLKEQSLAEDTILVEASANVERRKRL